MFLNLLAQSVIKVGIITLLVLFLLFVIVVWKQIRTMNQIVTQPSLYPILQAITFLIGLTGLALLIMTVVMV